MKIEKVKWRNHPILGDLEIDLINPQTGKPFDTLVLAGENGTGKTTILESISNFLNMGSFEYFELIEYNIDGEKFKAIPPTTNPEFKDFFDILDSTGKGLKIRNGRNANFDKKKIEANLTDLRNFGCIFSKARADYKTQQIKSTTTKQLDIDKHDSDKEDDFTSLKQLIVDVQHQDNTEYAELNKGLGETPKSWSDFYITSKTYRFKNAFDTFFEKIQFDKVIDSGQEKTILFKKNNKTVSIDNLSTGEKQIVFRGIYLLKNSRNLAGSIIMIDEPELSMHPKWQKNILDYYKRLFTEGAHQTAQLFFSTHSEYILKEALIKKDENLVVILNDDNGVIKSKRIDAPSVLPSITSAETNYLAFDIVSNDYHIELYGWLQQKESKTTVKSCDDYIKNHRLYNQSIHGKVSSFGNTTYNTLTTFIRNAIDHPEPNKTFSELELRNSIQLLIELCK